MIELMTWAARWGVPLAAVRDLERGMGIAPELGLAMAGKSEEAVSSQSTLAASRDWGGVLWRNNVGALLDDRGKPVRYGLCNESTARNKVFKSSDKIGIRPVLITQGMVGLTIGQFAAVEDKKGDWTYSGDTHEAAQLAFGAWVTRLGGYFRFYTGGTL